MAETHRDEHGHSVAAWTTVVTLIVASALIAIGVAWGLAAFWIAGIVLAALGIAAGLILGKAGFGNAPMEPPPAPQHLQRGVDHTGESAGRAAKHSVSEDDGPRSAPQTASN